MKCPSCNKFASMDTADPEVGTEDFDSETGEYNIEVRLVRNSSCCGDEMKEASFQFDGAIPEEILEKHKGEGHKITMDVDANAIEEGGGRYAKSYYGVECSLGFNCTCQEKKELHPTPTKPIYETEVSDKVPASGMDELC